LRPEDLPFLQLFAPIFFVIGAIHILGPNLPMARGWARQCVFAAVWLIVARYLYWRLFTTVVPADGSWLEVSWVWFCFAVEMFALFDALILYLTFLRTTDRRAEADRHEARLRNLAPGELPSVDVYIPTYNEPVEVLEKTITGALSLDYPNFDVWVLDDGRRPWLKELCEAKGAGYLTRPDNANAKAGNINHALTKTGAQFVAVFDADFVPQRNFLMRTIGFFEDPSVGIVQTPHAFYNHDPMQANLALRKTQPDDQRFFFEAIMPSRDAWNAAFCCGSNSVTRREALRAIGDALPITSITEDMMLTLAMLRKGYVTRYLCERLAFGLAPENIKAFFVQRQRWARGAMQILFQADGPLGRNLTLMQRLLFLPTHWLSQSLMLMVSIVAPIVFLWTDTKPLVNVTAEAVIFYLLPMVLAVIVGLWVYAPRQYFPFGAQVLGTFQSFKILPTTLATLIKPRSHIFKVTPKGAEAQRSDYQRGVFWAAATLMLLTHAGLIINTIPEWRIVSQPALVPMVAFWAAINVVILLLVCMISLQTAIRRGEERFDFNEAIWILTADDMASTARIKDVSLSGIGVAIDHESACAARIGDTVRVFLGQVGFVTGEVVRRADNFLGIQFGLQPSIERDLMIRKLFTSGRDNTVVEASAFSATAAILKSIWATRSALPELPQIVEMTGLAEKLPAQSLVVSPRQSRGQPKEITRQAMAA
jgi:cellulose synthase/poly-beta-1,6-N-acetylglucosamine synthase-like glycosyltransferase